MRYYYERPHIYTDNTGVTYECDHPIYNFGTLYLNEKKGLVIIQQRIGTGKRTYWGPIDPWLVDQVFFHNGFKELFDKYAAESSDGIYPTMTIRQAMWFLKMKPMKREPWETSFDRNVL